MNNNDDRDDKVKKCHNLFLLLSGIALLIITVLLLAGTHYKSFILKSANQNLTAPPPAEKKVAPKDFSILWTTDFRHNRVLGTSADGKLLWEQNMSAPPIPRSSWYFIGGIEYVTVAPNGNLITVHGDGMMVQEIDRKTHNLVWQYGIAGRQSYRGGLLDEPDKSFKFNDHEVVINDGNDREVIVVDQRTNQVVWQYGQYEKIGSTPGLLHGNTSVVPLKGGEQFLITDTSEKKIMIIDRATKNIVWQWTKPDSEWIEHVFPTTEGTFIMEDRLKNEVFEVSRDGKILWTLSKLADGSNLSYPTDTAKLENGDVLIAEAGRERVIEVVPQTGVVVREFKNLGFVTSMAIDYQGL